MLDTVPRMKFWLSCNMKQILCIALGIAFSCGLFGCSAKQNPAEETMPIPSEIVVTDPTILETPVEENVETLETEVVENSTSEEVVMNTYISITGAEAKTLMESEENYIILDVRTQEEFDEGHIAGAILIPDYEIAEKAEDILTDKEQLILVYCRSGRRSKLASAVLAEMGYTNVKEFGGVIDWEYGLVTDEKERAEIRI